MIDINLIRSDPEKVKRGCRARGVLIDIDYLLELDKKKKELLKKVEKISALKNRASKKIPVLKKEEREKIISEMKTLDKEHDRLKEKLKKIEDELFGLLVQIPNLPLERVPVGKDDSENVVIKEGGKKPEFNFPIKDHLELGEALDIIDVKRAAKVSGSRFGYLKREAVFLEFALIMFAFEKITQKGFIPLIPPVLIRPEMMWAMGYIDTKEDREERYFLEKDNLFLVGTAEQAIGPMHKDEILERESLPLRYLGFSSCFREEAGSYGKDTRGIFRVHQFDKIEMFVFSDPEQSAKEHQLLLEIEEELLMDLNLPYRLIQICTGDMVRPSAKSFDFEVWIPSQNRYREVMSASNCTDFQARRLNIRYRDKNGKLHFVHTLNATALAIGRMIIAILENYQQKDGSVLIPSVLKKYLNFTHIKR